MGRAERVNGDRAERLLNLQPARLIPSVSKSQPRHHAKPDGALVGRAEKPLVAVSRSGQIRDRAPVVALPVLSHAEPAEDDHALLGVVLGPDVRRQRLDVREQPPLGWPILGPTEGTLVAT